MVMMCHSSGRDYVTIRRVKRDEGHLQDDEVHEGASRLHYRYNSAIGPEYNHELN